MTDTPPAGGRRPSERRSRDDAGGVWIRVGIAGGVLVYLGVLVLLHAGFTAILPFAVIPPVLLVLIAANSLLGGPRRPRPPARPIRPTDRGIVPPDTTGPQGNGRSGRLPDPPGTAGTADPPGTAGTADPPGTAGSGGGTSG